MEGKTHILAYGGSVVCPKLDKNKNPIYSEDAIKNLCNIFNLQPKSKFVVVIGGGALASLYQDRKKKKIEAFLSDSYEKGMTKNTTLDEHTKNYLLDREGILATVENAKKVSEILTKSKLEGKIYSQILTEPYAQLDEDGSRIYLAGGHIPGASTDFVLMKYAESFGADIVHKISNFDAVLNIPMRDFDLSLKHNYPVLRKTSFIDMVGLVGRPEDFRPRDKTPLDPSAAKLGAKLARNNPDFTLNIGKMEELSKMIAGETFYGTVVKGSN